jgi:hypothetical protein
MTKEMRICQQMTIFYVLSVEMIKISLQILKLIFLRLGAAESAFINSPLGTVSNQIVWIRICSRFILNTVRSAQNSFHSQRGIFQLVSRPPFATYLISSPLLGARKGLYCSLSQSRAWYYLFSKTA